VAGGRRRLHDEQGHNLFSTSIFLLTANKDDVGGYVARMGIIRNMYKVLVGKYEGKRLLARLRRRLQDNIKIDLKQTG
jgi:hypothetical protein